MKIVHKAAFHQDLHCLLRQNQSSEKEIMIYLKTITYDPSIYTMDHLDLTASNLMGNSICPKRVKYYRGSDISGIICHKEIKSWPLFYTLNSIHKNMLIGCLVFLFNLALNMT